MLSLWSEKRNIGFHIPTSQEALPNCYLGMQQATALDVVLLVIGDFRYGILGGTLLRGLTYHGYSPLTKWDDPPSMEY